MNSILEVYPRHHISTPCVIPSLFFPWSKRPSFGPDAVQGHGTLLSSDIEAFAYTLDNIVTGHSCNLGVCSLVLAEHSALTTARRNTETRKGGPIGTM